MTFEKCFIEEKLQQSRVKLLKSHIILRLMNEKNNLPKSDKKVSTRNISSAVRCKLFTAKVSSKLNEDKAKRSLENCK